MSVAGVTVLGIVFLISALSGKLNLHRSRIYTAHAMGTTLQHARKFDHSCTFLTTVSVRAQQNDSVVCSSDDNCDDDIGVNMSARDCCVNHPNGTSYTIPDQEICVVCIGK